MNSVRLDVEKSWFPFSHLYFKSQFFFSSDLEHVLTVFKDYILQMTHYTTRGDKRVVLPP